MYKYSVYKEYVLKVIYVDDRGQFIINVKI